MRRVFDQNDFDAVYARYFEDIVASGLMAADPSGWARTEAEGQFQIPPASAPPLLSHYIVDNRKLIAKQKDALLRLLSDWDHQEYAFDEVTITPSISSASLAVLLLLRSRGVASIFFETPGYYVALEQASSVGLRSRRIPSYHDSGYEWATDTIRRERRKPTAVWLTQPRYVLGDNQTSKRIHAVLSALGKEDFLIVDETADQQWPSALSTIGINRSGPFVIKIRGYMKPLGLNALRIALIIHSASLRSLLQEYQWIVGAALDHYSLESAVRIASEPGMFQSMLSAARKRIAITRRRLAVLAMGSPLTLSSMENGYLGSVVLQWSSRRGSYAEKRRTLLEHCRMARMPVTLGSAMLFARDPARQHIRLNYFMPTRDLEYCIEQLALFAREVVQVTD